MINFKIYDTTDWTTNNYNQDILPDISRSKDNQTLKFGQLIRYRVRIFFFKNHAENEVGRLVLDLFLFFKKVLKR